MSKCVGFTCNDQPLNTNEQKVSQLRQIRKNNNQSAPTNNYTHRKYVGSIEAVCLALMTNQLRCQLLQLRCLWILF